MSTALIFRPIYTPNMARRARMVSAADLLRTCRAAAKLSLQGDAWSAEDRADLSAHLVGVVWQRAAKHAPQGWHPPMRLPRAIGFDYVPANLCGLDFLVKRGANWREARESERERDSIEAAARAALEFSPAVETGETAELRGTPYGARRTALEMLRNAGLLSWSGESPAGPMWTLAYSAARAAAGLESDAIATELELTPAQYRQHLSRAAKRVRYGNMPQWYEALAVLAPDALQHAAPLEPSERYRPDSFAPVECRTDKRLQPRAKLAQWAAPRTVQLGSVKRRIDPLPHTTHARLAKATDMRRKRASAKSADERRASRLAAGLPPAVQ